MRKPVLTAKRFCMRLVDLNFRKPNSTIRLFSNFSLILVCIPQTVSGTWKTQMFLTDLFPYPTQTIHFPLVGFTIKLRRKPTYFVLNVIVPR